MTSATPLAKQSLADLVTEDARIAAILDRAGLDYCCHGHQPLEDAARARGLEVDRLVADIDALGPVSAEDRQAADWPELDVLISHIVHTHHRYVKEISPVIGAWLEKLVARHGSRHPELAAVRDAFSVVASDMAVHMKKEEHILFPFIDALAAADRSHGHPPSSPFGTVVNPIRMMEADHRDAGDELARLRALTNGYTAPADACTTYRLCYAELERFEADLHRHVHLENHVLFPRATELERRVI